MSAQRFIRCKHCGMPHEALASSCPITGKALAPERRRGSARPPAPAPASYQWAHSLHPQPAAGEADEEATRDVSSMCGRIVESKYRIDEPIGRGGMGVVYRAENVRIGKHVAIKILLKGYSKGSESERRFLREARIAGSIGHPNIAQVFDLGTLEDGAPYQVMELLEGQTLAQRIRHEGALPIPELLDYAEQMLSALSAAHERGIIHRDLKPDNIFLHSPPRERQGHSIAKLLDFGVSKSLLNDATLSLTQTGVIVGTPYYLAPEQARGERKLDHRVDIWAMGIVLYEGLTGTLPFRADNYNALMAKILGSRASAPRAIRPSIPEAIEAVVLRALAFEPKDRFESADVMLAALRDARTEGRLAQRHPFDELPDVPRMHSAQPIDSTLHDLRISAVQGPEDPTEVSESFSYSDIEATRKSR